MLRVGEDVVVSAPIAWLHTGSLFVHSTFRGRMSFSDVRMGKRRSWRMFMSAKGTSRGPVPVARRRQRLLKQKLTQESQPDVSI